jgi:hypothetical protein
MLISVRSFNTPEFVARRGARTKWRQSSDLHAELKLGDLISLGAETRFIIRAIGFRVWVFPHENLLK